MTDSKTIEKLEVLMGEQAYRDKRVSELRSKLKGEVETLETLKNARKIVQMVVASTQLRFKEDVEALMTLAIHSVFKRFTFELEWKTLAARSDLNFNIKDGDDVLNLEDDLGCSILDIVSFISRPVFHRYQQNPSRSFLLIDEGFKWVGRGRFLKAAGELMKLVARERGYQILFITHEPHFANVADTAFLVTNKGNRSKLAEMKPEELAELLEGE